MHINNRFHRKKKRGGGGDYEWNAHGLKKWNATLLLMTASCWENLITAPDLYISIHVCRQTRHMRPVPRLPPVRRKQKGGQVIDSKGTLERCIKIRYYRLACCRVSSAGADTELCSLKQSVWCGITRGGIQVLGAWVAHIKAAQRQTQWLGFWQTLPMLACWVAFFVCVRWAT